jgi:peptide/nickel transport system substrate-binding protein
VIPRVIAPRRRLREGLAASSDARRRVVVQRVGSLGLVVACGAICLALAGCGGGSVSPAAAQTAGGGEIGKVTWVPYFGEPTILSVGQATAGYPEATILPNLCDNVLRLTPDDQLEPGLAQLVQHPDPLTYVFRMRGEAHFWDGRPVTAADAVFSLQQSIAPTAANAFYLGGVKSVAKRGATEFVVRLSAPDVAFPDYLASGAGLVAEKRYVQAKGKSYGTPQGGVMCSGPFEFKSWVRGQSLTIVRNPHYWDPALEPHVGEIVFDFITDPTTLTSALLSGGVSGTFAAPPADLARLQGSSAGTLTQGSSLQVASVSAAATHGALANGKVREALNIAVDRNGIAKAIYDGAADPVRSAILPATWSYDKAAFQRAYDALPGATAAVSAATRLVSEAGFKGAPITIAASGTDPTSQSIAVYVQSVADAIGLRAKLKIYPSETQFLSLFYDAKARAAIDAIININLTPVPEPLGFVASMALPTGLNNYDEFSDPHVTALVSKALATNAPAARARLITRADALFERETNNIILVTPRINLWQSRGITGAPANATYLSLAWGALLRPTKG